MKRILVIEDNPEVRDNLCEILELAGYAVEEAPNGKDGAFKAKKTKPDLIICDVMMPELDGFGVLKILNKDPETFDIPFIFLTAKTEMADLRKGMGLGADDYITKPFDDVELLEALEMRLKKAERHSDKFNRSEDGLQRFFSEAKAQEELQNLSLDREIRNFKKKDIVFEEGQGARWLYFVVKGSIKTYQINSFGKELITHIFRDGDFFGYYPLLTDKNYATNAMAMEDTVLRLVPKNDFTLLLFNNRDFAAQFIKMIAARASDTEKQLIDLAYSSVRKKVANALLSLKSSSLGQDSQKLLFTCSRDDLASLAGTAKETVIRTLSDFKSENILELEGSQIQILDLSKLESMQN